MKLLIIGSGGREHSLGWKLKQSSKVNQLYFAPGNGGTQELGENVNIDAADIENLAKFAKKNAIDLTIVGPETPLAMGIVDLFDKKGLKIFGPTKKAAQLETSKAWSALFMKRHGIPSPEFRVFSDPIQAISFIKSDHWHNPVIKADGLALGKGVLIPQTAQEAVKAVNDFMIAKQFGQAGRKIVIQEKLAGQEISLIGFCDGKTIIPLLPVQDHKRISDGDRGLNTGGVGAYTPTPFVSKKQLKKINESILIPVLKGLRKEKIIYKGVLYIGLMITAGGPKVLEFNVRFGDPETQPQLLLLKSDLLELVEACIHRRLEKIKIVFRKGYAVCVVLTAKGYPNNYQKGDVITGLNNIKDTNIKVFHAGTCRINQKILTNGGRVLGITATDLNLITAIRKAYSVIGENGIFFSGMHYRKDIGKKALNV